MWFFNYVCDKVTYQEGYLVLGCVTAGGEMLRPVGDAGGENGAGNNVPQQHLTYAQVFFTVSSAATGACATFVNIR